MNFVPCRTVAGGLASRKLTAYITKHFFYNFSAFFFVYEQGDSRVLLLRAQRWCTKRAGVSRGHTSFVFGWNCCGGCSCQGPRLGMV